MPASSAVRTSTGTVGRMRRIDLRMPTEIAGLEKLMMTALAVSSPAVANICSSEESPKMTGSPA